MKIQITFCKCGSGEMDTFVCSMCDAKFCKECIAWCIDCAVHVCASCEELHADCRRDNCDEYAGMEVIVTGIGD